MIKFLARFAVAYAVERFFVKPQGPFVRDWIAGALDISGQVTSPGAIAALERIALQETGCNPNYTHPSGARGLFALMPYTWEHFNVGGAVHDPVPNGAAAIHYHLARYGDFVDESSYAQGGQGGFTPLKGKS